MRVQGSRALDHLSIPGRIVTRESQRLPQVCLHCCVNANPDEVIELTVGNGTDDPGWTCHVPLAVDRLAIPGDCVFLCVVEVIVHGHSRVRFERWYSSWS